MTKNLILNEAAAFSPKSPYEIYQEWEGIPVYKDFIIPDLLKLELGDWARTGGKAGFVNMDGSGGTCDIMIEEIAAGGQLKPIRHMYEKAIFILEGQGATTTMSSSRVKPCSPMAVFRCVVPIDKNATLFYTKKSTKWREKIQSQGAKPLF